MKPKRLYFLPLIFIFMFSCSSCKKESENKRAIYANNEHLFYLYEEVKLPNDSCGGVLHIYSEYPDYHFEIEPNEGFTCVDDVARAIMINHQDAINYEKYASSIRCMPEFLLYMQAENGYFHNFIWDDLSINKTYQTSVAEPNWWSWRAFWALTADHHYELFHNSDLEDRVNAACEKLAENIFDEYMNTPMDLIEYEGMEIPTWLPLQTAGDQAALLILGLIQYNSNVKHDERALQLIERLAEGLLHTQKGDSTNFPYGAYLSWKNMWHAYGNMQAYAMFGAGNILQRDDFIQSALLEIDHFYPYLIEQNYLNQFTLRQNGDQFEVIEMQQFPQIAYGIRPMVWACIAAYFNTDNVKYLHRAEEIASWLVGNNIAGQKMFDPYSGRCYDGIISPSEINLNSGAESTVEALLTMQVFVQVPHLTNTEWFYEEY